MADDSMANRKIAYGHGLFVRIRDFLSEPPIDQRTCCLPLWVLWPPSLVSCSLSCSSAGPTSPGSTPVQSLTNSCRESCALQFLRISKEMLENLVKIDVLKLKVPFSL